MYINQSNQSGDNNISFEIKGGINDLSEIKTINSFENSDEIRKFYKKQKWEKRIAYLLALLQFVLAPVYGYYILKFFFK